MNLVKKSFTFAFAMLKAPSKTLVRLRSQRSLHAFTFLLIVGAVTALLTPVQISLGFEDVNGLHAGGQAEFLAKDISATCKLGIEWRPVLVEALYVFILLVSTGYLHVICKAVGGKGTIGDTFKIMAYGDAPGLLFGWIPYFATIAAIWAAVIQLIIGPVVLHKISWAKASVIFAVLVGIGLIEITLKL